MSAKDQPLFVATMNYHVGHTISIRVAQEQGYFRDEGLGEIEFDGRGLLPRRFEREAIALTMEERGVDIGLGAGTGTAFHQRSLGADLFIVGGWRLDGPAGTKWYTKAIRDMKSVRGKRIGLREHGSMDGDFLARELVKVGVDPQRDVEWVLEPTFYGDNPEAVEALTSGRVDLAPIRPASWNEADACGLTVLLDSVSAYPNGRPGKIIIATGKTIRERRADLAAFLRANTRAFWFVRNPENFDYVTALDARSRVTSFNEDEHAAGHLVTKAEACEAWPMPLDGGADRGELEKIMNEFVKAGSLAQPIPVGEVLKDEIVREAYQELCARPESQPALERNRRLTARYGY